jgi:hypothetical protein
MRLSLCGAAARHVTRSRVCISLMHHHLTQVSAGQTVHLQQGSRPHHHLAHSAGRLHRGHDCHTRWHRLRGGPRRFDPREMCTESPFRLLCSECVARICAFLHSKPVVICVVSSVRRSASRASRATSPPWPESATALNSTRQKPTDNSASPRRAMFS